MASKNKNSLLWRLESPVSPGPSWLFGTMHVKDKRAFRLLEPVKARILECDAFATEFKLDDPGMLAHAADLTLPPGQALDSLMRPRHYEKLRSILLRAVNLDLNSLRHVKPLVIINLVDERLLSQEMPIALDQALFQFAKQEEKELLGIETYSEQLKIMGRISLKDQVRALRSLGSNIRTHRRHLIRMTERYEKGELQSLYQSARRGAHKMRGPLLYHRNARMASRIGDLARETTIFCAIGAAHLPGEKGILRLLKQQGFKVTGTF